MAKRTKASYEEKFSDLVDTYSLNVDSIYGRESLEEQMKLIDRRNKFKDKFFDEMFNTSRASEAIEENVKKEEVRIKDSFRPITTDEELAIIEQQELQEAKDDSMKYTISKERKVRQLVIARIQSTEKKRELRKQQLFADAESSIQLGQYKRWSALKGSPYNLTDEEIQQLQSENPQIDLI